jgi:hypothetical protein
MLRGGRLKQVGDDRNSWLINLLGFDHGTSMQLLVSTGLIKIGHSSNSSAIVVVKAGWDKFVHEERLQDLMEVPNRTQVGNDRYFFINLGDKKLLSHRPGEQFNGKFLE